MANLAFELGFDWNIPAIMGVRDGVFPLQLYLCNDDSGTVISPCNPSSVLVEDTLSFRVYDFTDPNWPPAGGSPSPTALQVLFTSATTADSRAPFSPILDGSAPLAQLVATSFTLEGPMKSIAYGTGAVNGWTVGWSGIDEPITFQQGGRFKFRALLTVVVPGQMARFYRVDPEMVIGPPGSQG